jgi:putative transposase
VPGGSTAPALKGVDVSGLARIRTVADVVDEVKKSSSKWMKQQGVDSFFWLAGYGAFSIGEPQVPALIKYIARQEEHHRHLSFQEEFRRLLQSYGVSYDEHVPRALPGLG